MSEQASAETSAEPSPVVGDPNVILVNVTSDQCRMIIDAEHAKTRAAERAQLLVSAIAAGHVPEGATLININADANVLTFHVTRPASTS